MVFSSLPFLMLFLPPVLISSAIVRKKIFLQNIILLLASLIFYSFGEPTYIWLFLCTIAVNWFIPFLFRKQSHKVKKVAGVSVIIFDIILLLWFKYANWISHGIGFSFGGNVLPIGISFYTFQAISYVADVMLIGRYEAETSPISVGLYIAFFPQLIAGPIVRYEEIREQIRYRVMSFTSLEEGFFRFSLGFCKKVLLADSMAVIANTAFNASHLTFPFAWLGAVAYTFQIYIDFSGYSDMAIGLGRLFGFEIPENFDIPYVATSIRDFWRRWHITLSIWFRDYVYIPLGGSRSGRLRTVFNILVVWLLTGFWHGANFTFLTWGVVYGVLVLLEKILNIDQKLSQGNTLLKLVYRLFTFIIILLLWVVFRSDNIFSALSYIVQMFHFNTENIDVALLYLSEYKWAFGACIGLSVVKTDTLLRKRGILWPAVFCFFMISISYLVKGTYSPFLYFNF